MTPRRIGLLLLFAFLVACGASARHKTLQVALTTVTAADTAFVEVNRLKLDEAVSSSTSYEDGLLRIEAWETRSDPVLAAIKLAYQVIAAAALDETVSIDEVIAQAAAIVQQVRNLRGAP